MHDCPYTINSPVDDSCLMKSINIAHQDSPDLKIIIINNYNIRAHTLQTITCKNYTKISHCGEFEYIIKSTIIQHMQKALPPWSILFLSLNYLSWSLSLGVGSSSCVAANCAAARRRRSSNATGSFSCICRPISAKCGLKEGMDRRSEIRKRHEKQDKARNETRERTNEAQDTSIKHKVIL